MVIDTSAILAILKQEPDAPVIAQRLAGNQLMFMSAATLMECGTVVVGRYGAAGTAELRGLLERLKVTIVALTAEHAQAGIEAYALYGRGTGHPAKLNMGDCFSYALARTRNLPLLFKGNDFIHTDIEPALKPA
ncbi:type II toxin-antitoxin system VapC family toxin [Mesorhizobium sp. M7A.F.Ca.CA.001.07.2.1]|uniref:type II toxin-antitoxin system VapC family toxin n=3 Tax=Phyllobacteriaceae TaxID=69277 RepID=UPI000FCC9EED|nr:MULTISPECIES: type II toxin-antitoxin system VapC family toxin [Mesorhizobium]MCQ8814972.1 type II toxin-antitoxin system VapC family toxin [Mesorhizobium sp. SEMIA396]MCQ8870565.1 type II toxin-antitoxin system VapC family toxin [Mesorhizobium sp. LMG17149]RUU57033.1 type II toxin-antitoxin system VapC family toxin [Mesorhizobium sp. M7A.T.Ca.TU.009.01.1.1]RUU84063.1 type II toxin-antitoxin system VapC family toxin [Mesorhizobium sp. M7A.T.Ca.TU.009.01.1.2]RUV49553.1 type II toxin-antitoxi